MSISVKLANLKRTKIDPNSNLTKVSPELHTITKLIMTNMLCRVEEILNDQYKFTNKKLNNKDLDIVERITIETKLKILEDKWTELNQQLGTYNKVLISNNYWLRKLRSIVNGKSDFLEYNHRFIYLPVDNSDTLEPLNIEFWNVTGIVIKKNRFVSIYLERQDFILGLIKTVISLNLDLELRAYFYSSRDKNLHVAKAIDKLVYYQNKNERNI